MTNPYLTAARKRYDAIRAEIQTFQTRAGDEHRDLTDDELATITRTSTEARDLAAAIEHMTEEQTRADAVRSLAAQVDGDAAQSLGYGGPDAYAQLGGGEPVPNLMPSPDQVAEMFRSLDKQTAHRWTVDQPDIHHRAALTTATVGVGVSVGTGGRALREPRRISTAVPLPVERVQGVEGLAFPVFAAGTADVVAEGATKPEYAAVTAGSATPQVIAVWTDFTRQATLSMPSFEARLRAKHAALVAKREDVLLVAQLNAVVGSQTYVGTTATTPAYSDSLLAGCGLVLSSDVAAPPDIILVNPADLPLIFPADTTQGLNGTTPDSALRLTLHGATVYPTSAVTAGTAIVAALAASSRFVVGMAPRVLIDAVSQLKSNKITSLMEEAVTLAIDEPTGVVLVDLIPPAA
ncbi:MAG: hypothetical protein L0I76_26875 [Pseudonocardia sp.]|nr:hypothetical protein [Pseudonocardia sp.]